MATKREKAHLDRVASLPCVACGAMPVQVHHIRDGQGMSQRASHFLTVPLCQDCHTGPLSIHMAKRQFEGLFGSEIELLAKTIEALQED